MCGKAKTKAAPKKARKIELHLEKRGYGKPGYYLVAYANGRKVHDGHILSIYDDGTIGLHRSLNDNIGFQVDEDGRAVIKHD